MADKPSDVWRDYNTDGVPSSGYRRPVKSEIRAAFQQAHLQFKTTSYTTEDDDGGTMVLMNSGSATVITFHANATAGTQIIVGRYGTGTVTWAAASGATVRNENSHTGIANRYGEITATCVSNTDGASAVWWIKGSTS